jgi:hypothetical protein
MKLLKVGTSQRSVKNDSSNGLDDRPFVEVRSTTTMWGVEATCGRMKLPAAQQPPLQLMSRDGCAVAQPVRTTRLRVSRTSMALLTETMLHITR